MNFFQKVEVKNGDTLVVVYFDDMTATAVCPVFQAFRTSNVAYQKPAPVIAYDYYDNSEDEIRFLSHQMFEFLFISLQLVLVEHSTMHHWYHHVTSASEPMSA